MAVFELQHPGMHGVVKATSHSIQLWSMCSLRLITEHSCKFHTPIYIFHAFRELEPMAQPPRPPPLQSGNAFHLVNGRSGFEPRSGSSFFFRKENCCLLLLWSRCGVWFITEHLFPHTYTPCISCLQCTSAL